MNSRGCKPTEAFNQNSFRPRRVSHRCFQFVHGFGPFRAMDICDWRSRGLHPRLFTSAPSGDVATGLHLDETKLVRILNPQYCPTANRDGPKWFRLSYDRPLNTMQNLKVITLLVATAAMFLCGCSTSSHVLVGTARPAIDPSQVKLYLRPPAKYEEVALVSGDSARTFAGASGQTKMNAAISHMKKEAAKLGANGILLGTAGNQYGGSVGTGFGSATVVGGGTAYGTGTSVSSPVWVKEASGLAIYVTQE